MNTLNFFLWWKGLYAIQLVSGHDPILKAHASRAVIVSRPENS